MSAADWRAVRIGGPGGRSKGSIYEHVPSGWRVEHCGGFSATNPYALRDPQHPDAATVSWNGMGFGRLKVAQAVVEAIVAGRCKTSDRDCTPGTRVVVGVTAGGERLSPEYVEHVAQKRAEALQRAARRVAR